MIWIPGFRASWLVGIYRGFANWISLGNGSNVAALGSTLGATSASPTAVVYQDLAALFGSLDNLYVQNASWVMSSATRASLMGLISTTGQPILAELTSRAIRSMPSLAVLL